MKEVVLIETTYRSTDVKSNRNCTGTGYARSIIEVISLPHASSNSIMSSARCADGRSGRRPKLRPRRSLMESLDGAIFGVKPSKRNGNDCVPPPSHHLALAARRRCTIAFYTLRCACRVTSPLPPPPPTARPVPLYHLHPPTSLHATSDRHRIHSFPLRERM